MANDQNYPIILAHGIARFDFLLAGLLRALDRFGLDLSAPTDGINYFKGIARHLRSNGFDVHHSSVSFASPVEKRAEELRAEVTNVLKLRGSEKVHIIAHSMGGLDARHMIVGHGMEDRVASLTTIGTPHLGTSFADWGIANKGHDIIESLKNVIDLEGFKDLTVESCAKFNELARNAEAKNGVVYHTYAGSQEKAAVFGPLQPSWEFINEAEGDNDGLVSVTSQRWQAELVSDDGVRKPIGQSSFPVQVDHLNEVGWWDLQEMKHMGGLSLSLLGKIKDFELSIKNVYLEIARSL
jgi:triacylglycerol lipase